MRQNEDTRRISAWVAIGVIPTIVAGLFGMNLGGIPGGDALGRLRRRRRAHRASSASSSIGASSDADWL